MGYRTPRRASRRSRYTPCWQTRRGRASLRDGESPSPPSLQTNADLRPQRCGQCRSSGSSRCLILAHSLTPREYGVLELVLVAGAFLALFVDLGFASASQRSYFDYPAEQQRERRVVLATALSMSAGIALVLCSHRRWVLGSALRLAVRRPRIPKRDHRLRGRDPDRSGVAVFPRDHALDSPPVALCGVGDLHGGAWRRDRGMARHGSQCGPGWSPDRRPYRGRRGSASLDSSMVRHELVVGFSRRELGIMLRYGLPLVPSGIAPVGTRPGRPDLALTPG